MDKIEQLIKHLSDLKEELEKASANPALAPKEVKVKQLKAQVDAGTYKPDPKKIADKMIGKADEDHPATLSHEDVKKLTKKEELTCSANGQWNLNKAKDYSKMPVRHITSAKAVSEHGYELTHHYPDGKTSGPHPVAIAQTGIRLKSPGKTHAIHLKGQAEPVHTDEATAHQALKQGTFDFDAHSKKALKKNNEELEKAKASVGHELVANLSSGGKVIHHTKTPNNYTIKHPKGDVHVFHDGTAEKGWASYNQHKEDNENGSGFPKHLANHPKIQAHIDEGIKAIKAHQAKMENSSKK